MPQRARVVARFDRDDIADRLVFEDLPHRLPNVRVVPPAQAGDDGEILLLRLAARLHDALDAGRVDGDRLLDEAVLALVDGVREVLRPEMGRRRQQHDVDAAVDHLLVAVEADEHVVVGHLHAVLDFIDPLVAPRAEFSA